MTTSNYLTLSRIGFIPIFGVFLYMPQDWTYPVSTCLFALAAITDWLDGHLARKWGEETRFGAFLDPVADKLLVVVALVLLLQKEEYRNFWVTLAGMIIICREIVIAALREWMAELGKRASIAVSRLGKWKTGMQITAIIMLCLFKPTFEYDGIPFGLWGNYLAQVILYIAAVLTLWSMIQYLQLAFKEAGIAD